MESLLFQETLLFPIIMLAVTLAGGGILLLVLKTARKRPQTDPGCAAMQTAQQFINVKDIRDKYLYTHDGMVFVYLRIHAGTYVSIGFKPVDNGTLINAISRSVVQQRGLAESAKDPLSRQRAEKAAEDGEKVIMQIDREGETVGLMSVEVMPVAGEEKELTKACRRAESIASVMKCRMRAIPNLQKEAFMHLSPTFPNHGKIESILQKVVPFSTFVGGFPFASSGFNDGEGYYFAKDTGGGLVIVDVWRRGGDRTNQAI